MSGTKLDTVYYDLEARTTNLGPGVQKAKQLLGSLVEPANAATGAIKGLGTALTGLAGAAAVYKITQALTAAVGAAQGFEKQMALVQTVIDPAAISMDVLHDKTLQLFRDLPLENLGDLTKGLYDVVSSGVAAGKSIEYLETAAKAGIAGVSTTAVAVDALTTATNAWRNENLTAADVADKMFQAVNKGKLTFEQLASSIGTIAPIAAGYGVSIDDVLGATAQLTLGGLTASESMVGIRSAITNIINPTGDLAREFPKLAKEFTATKLEAVGFSQFLIDFNKAAGGSKDAINALFSDVQGKTAVFSLLADGGRELAKQVEAVGNSSGAMTTAFDIISETSAALNQRLRNELTVTLVHLGEAVLPAFNVGLHAALVPLKLVADNVDVLIAAAGLLALKFGGGALSGLITSANAARAASIGAAQSSVAATAATLKEAQAEALLAAARRADTAATLAAIEAERTLAIAALQTANARLASARAGTGGAAGFTATEALAAQEVATRRLSAATAQLSALGQQQARVNAQVATSAGVYAAAEVDVAIASQAAAVAQTELTAVTRGTTVAMGVARTAALALWTAMGGWIGAGLIALFAVYKTITGHIEDAKKAQDALNDSTKAWGESLSVADLAGHLDAIRSNIEQVQAQLRDNPPTYGGSDGPEKRNALHAQLNGLLEQEKTLRPVLAAASKAQAAADVAAAETKAKLAQAAADANASAYAKASAAATRELSHQEALTRAFGESDDALADLNAAFALQGKLADINAEFTGHQAESLRTLAIETAAAERATRTAASAKTADAKLSADVLALGEKQSAQLATEVERRDALDKLFAADRAARAQAATAAKTSIFYAQAELDLLTARGKAAVLLREQLYFLQKLDEGKASGLDGVAAAAYAEEMLRIKRATDAASAGTKGWADDLERVVGIAQLIGAALEQAGVKFGKAIAQAATGLQSVLRGAENAGKAKSLTDKAAAGGQIVGGLLTIANALDLFGTKAKERAKEMREAAIVFNRALEEFVITTRTALQESLRGNLSRAEQVANQGAAANGFTGSSVFNSAEDITKQADMFRQAGTQMNRTLKGAGTSALAYAKTLDTIAAATLANEAKIRAANLLAIASEEENATIRSLVAQGRLDEAAAMRSAKTRQDELNAAIEKYGDTDAGKAYIAHLRTVQAEEQKAADAAARDPLKNFDSQASAFGLSGKAYLDGFTAAVVKKFGAVAADAIDGLDLATEAGLDTFHARIEALWRDFNQDGVISDAEQSTIDSLGRIFTTASDLFEQLDTRIARSLDRVADDNAILGGDVRTTVGRTVAGAKGFDAVLDGILAGVDLSTSDGTAAFRKQLQAYYVELGRDGYSAAEKPIVDLIKRLFSDVGDVIDAEESEAAARDGKNANAAALGRSTRSDRATRDIAVGDLAGADAFAVALGGMLPELEEFFGVFDVTTTAGIAAANAGVTAFLATLDALSDAEVLAKFGVTRDVVTQGILAVDTALDGMGATAVQTANAMENAANALQDFTASIDDSYLRASGNERQADLNQAAERVKANIEKATELHASQDVLDKITETGRLNANAINARYDAATASVAAAVAPASSGGTGTTAVDSRSAFIASGVSAITETHANQLTSYAATAVVLQREMAGYLRLLAGGAGALASRVPLLPAGVGGFSGRGAGGVSVNLYVSGPISGMTPESAGKRILDQLLPALDAAQFRAAGIEAKNIGVPL